MKLKGLDYVADKRRRSASNEARESCRSSFELYYEAREIQQILREFTLS
jgi:hypothetical protein